MGIMYLKPRQYSQLLMPFFLFCSSPLQKCKVLITGLPDSGWSESDIFQLVQTFGTPSDIIMAMQIGKVSILHSLAS